MSWRFLPWLQCVTKRRLRASNKRAENLKKRADNRRTLPYSSSMNVLLKKSQPGIERLTAFRFDDRSGQARILVVLVVGLFLGMAVGAWWFRSTVPMPSRVVSEQPGQVGLSQSTIELLQHLPVPVEVRFYAVWAPQKNTEATKAFTGRIRVLLSKYGHTAGGKVQIKYFDTGARRDAAIAAADGIEPIQPGLREAEYLGLAITARGQKVILSSLSPEWEAALESDVSRAIAHVTTPAALPISVTRPVAALSSPADPAITEELLRAIPDLASRTFDDAAKILQAGALKEFTSAVKKMQPKVRLAEQQLADAQGRNSGADQQAALQKLQQVQAEQTEMLKAITAQLRARITTLERLKSVSRVTPH